MFLEDEDIQEILRLLDASGFDSMQLDTGRFRVVLRRSGEGGEGWTSETLLTPAGRGTGGEAVGGGAAPDRPGVPPSTEPGLVDIRASLAGTFYRAPKPGAEPFVEVGSRVDEETTLCILEAMKLMNSLRAGVTGAVAEICVENGEFVQQDAILMRVRTEVA
ncbi:MAG TPA: biotin/lipoyl-containing protein [Gammaproteobacteria bacterium]|nr:biotin/lipoyl-containing protein [Gammaproteobacteria bacterium]